MELIDAEILDGAVSIEGEVVPAETRTWDYPGFPACCEFWRVVALDRQIVAEYAEQDFEDDEAAERWVLSTQDEAACEAVLEEYGSPD